MWGWVPVPPAVLLLGCMCEVIAAVPRSTVQETSAWMLAAALADPCGRLLCFQAPT